jgi:hypothetical protein
VKPVHAGRHDNSVEIFESLKLSGGEKVDAIFFKSDAMGIQGNNICNPKYRLNISTIDELIRDFKSILH